MTFRETFILPTYFFVVIILAVYGWHRYYLVYVYMKNRGKEPKANTPLDPMPVVTIFAAYFIPPSDFLTRLMPHFVDPQVGMVQARWGHINQDYSLLTKIQSILLDGHFVLEPGGRNRAGHFFNFNGTAGVWRRCVIEDAGGWQHDTLTEDLDLSYRAQLAGWGFVYLQDVIAPGEVPGDINAFKSQQNRWGKGWAQTA